MPWALGHEQRPPLLPPWACGSPEAAAQRLPSDRMLSPLSARFIHQVNQAAITIQRWYRHQARRRQAQAASLGQLLASKLEVRASAGVGASARRAGPGWAGPWGLGYGSGGFWGHRTGTALAAPTAVVAPSPTPTLSRSLGRRVSGPGGRDPLVCPG